MNKENEAKGEAPAALEKEMRHKEREVGRPMSKELLAEMKKTFTKNIARFVDMNAELQSEAVDLIISAIDKFRNNYEAAAKLIKEQMDKKFGGTWHVVIGEAFGFEITYHNKNMILLYHQGALAVLLFKC